MLEWIGLARSFVVYWRPGRQRALRRLYSTFVREGDLVFDVGAHLGDRSVAFAALGARVIALEPQPHVARWLRRIVGRNDRIVVRTEAVGATPGTARLAISARHPTVSTLSEPWRTSMTRAHPGFEGVRWDESAEVAVVTLDELIRSHGRPSFCKIDVEGFEAEVLAGLNEPLPALSFEFVAGHLEVASACVRRLRELGSYRFNVVLGEGRRFAFDAWMDADAVDLWLSTGAGGASSGDVYARLGPAA
ncbi:MAG: FkbM family methyltransferase [Gemmatimonadetes bacterium]|nr:FkbM family methyltransferase [Gemmatimonadota bacterium]